VVTAYARRCLAKIRPEMRYYTTAVAVGDYDQVRAALGYAKINLYGGSYGPTMEQEYLRLFGAHVRTVVLDSGSLLDVHIWEQAARGAQRALELLFTRCAADAACHAAFPDLPGDVARAMARLAHGPEAVAKPAFTLTKVAFEGMVQGLLAYTESAPALPRLIHHAAQGDFAPLVQVALAGGGATQDLAYKLVIECSEPWASRRPAETARLSAGSFARDMVLFDTQITQVMCRVLPRGVTPADLGQRVHSTVPALLLNGAADPTDPPGNVANAHRELPNSLTVIVPGRGHGQVQDPSGCVSGLITRFITTGTVRGLDTMCVQHVPLPPIDTSS
jgi:pimeloyl-ACP methyl ester carboxylesterase